MAKINTSETKETNCNCTAFFNTVISDIIKNMIVVEKVGDAYENVGGKVECVQTFYDTVQVETNLYDIPISVITKIQNTLDFATLYWVQVNCSKRINLLFGSKGCIQSP